MNKPKPHVASYKNEEAARVKSLLQKYKVIAIADMTNMPSPQLQKLRATTKNSVFITMSKGRIIKIILDELIGKIKGIEQLKEHIKGMPALLLTNDNPFKLSKLLRKSKSSAPAKSGQLAPNDILITAGPTPFPPGPIIGELSQVGIKASVVDGKVTVKEDTVIVKEGQSISAQVATILTKLGIEPMEIGINLLVALEDGVVFSKQVLNIDETKYLLDLKFAYQCSFNLAFNMVYPTTENIRLLVKKAYLDCNALAESRKILTSNSIKKELAKANIEAEAIRSKLNLPEPEIKNEANQANIKINLDMKNKDAEIMNDEKVAQAVLKKLQDQKMTDHGRKPIRDKNFEKEEKMAKDVLKKLQDDKIKKK